MADISLADAIDLFLADVAKRAAPATVTHYKKRLSAFRRELGTRLLPTADELAVFAAAVRRGETPADDGAKLMPNTVAEFLGRETVWQSGPKAGQKKAPDTVRTTIVAWEQLQRWLVETGRLLDPLTKKMKKPGGRKRDALPTPAETKKLLEKAPDDFKKIYRAMRLTGTRPSEICKARIEDLDRTAGEIILVEHKTAAKTGKPRRIAVGHPALVALIDEAIGDRTAGRIFLRSCGLPWTAEALSNTYRRLRDAAGLRSELVLYLARHEHATELYRQLGDLKAVADALGHSQLSTTMRYTRVDGAQLKKNQSRFNEGLD